jgi:gamma-glutamyl:cysteine ligase YbdK (ATP-grasp superfamily)
MRKIGVEEELMLVDPRTGRLAAVSGKALRAHEQRVSEGRTESDDTVDHAGPRTPGDR